MNYILGSLLYAVASSRLVILAARFLVGGSSIVLQSAFFVYVAEREVEYETAYYAAQGHMDADADGSKEQIKLKERMYAYRVLGVGTSDLIGTGT